MLDVARAVLTSEENIGTIEARIDKQLKAIERAVCDGRSPRQ
jgi:flagellar biosynthesis/type III secretory pathway protein FliH